jgi:hypothetical protein
VSEKAALDEAFYRRVGDTLLGTASSRGPWHRDWQHGGPPAALLAGAIERADPDPAAFFVARVSVELLAPILIGEPMRLCVEPGRLGRRVQRFVARLEQQGQEVARALGLRIRRTELELPDERIMPYDPLPDPTSVQPMTFPFFRETVGYHTAVEVRVVRGPWGRGPAAAWLRPRLPLVAGEQTTALERLMIVADASNGVCPVLPIDRFSFVNADLAVHLHRHPRGEWIGLDARAIAERSGVGLNQSELFDEDGEIGRCLESLVIDHR